MTDDAEPVPGLPAGDGSASSGGRFAAEVRLPDWMAAPREAPPPVEGSRGIGMRRGFGRFRRRGLARRGVEDLVRTVSRLTGGAEIRRGWLQGIDARVKVAGLLALLILTTVLRRPAALGLVLAFAAAMVLFSRIPLRRIGPWLVVPLFSTLMMLPAATSLVTPGEPVWVLVEPGIGRSDKGRTGPERDGLASRLPRRIAVTDAGLVTAARVVLRTTACVSLMALLALTTPSTRLLAGLRSLGVPAMYVATLRMMERYLAVLGRSAEEIHRAKLARTIAPRPAMREQAWAAAGMGALFRRARALGEQVTLAMLARGYTGEVRLLEEPRLRPRDVLFAAALAAFGLFLWRIDR